MNSPIQKAFLEDGWIQVSSIFDDNVPVFFRLEANTLDHSYFFRIIFTQDSYAYYELYDKWIEEKLVGDLAELVTTSLWKGAFDHIVVKKIENLQSSILVALSNHYHHRMGRDKDWKSKRDYYDNLYDEHIKEKRKIVDNEMGITNTNSKQRCIIKNFLG